MKTNATAACAVLLAVALTGCGGGDTSKPKANNTAPPSAPTTGVVRGRLLEVGGPTNNRHPIAGTVTFKGPDGSIAKAPVDETGAFAIGLYPGRYEIRGTSPQVDNGRLPCSTASATTTLVAGKTVTADVICSIR